MLPFHLPPIPTFVYTDVDLLANMYIDSGAMRAMNCADIESYSAGMVDCGCRDNAAGCVLHSPRYYPEDMVWNDNVLSNIMVGSITIILIYVGGTV